MKLAPVVLFTFSRVNHTRETLDALRANAMADRTDLIVYSDEGRDEQEARNVRMVRQLIHETRGFRSVRLIAREKNFGLARNIVDGVTDVCGEYGEVIVLEDDMVTSPWFIAYMNQALRLYQNDERVCSVHGYCYPVPDVLPTTFFLRGADCWGWATWGRAWQHFEINGAKLLSELQRLNLEREFDLFGAYGFTKMLKDQIAGVNNSWAIRWHASCFLKNMLTLYPGQSLVTNIGLDGSGTHGGNTVDYFVGTSTNPIHLERIEIHQNELAREAFGRFLTRTRKSLFERGMARVAKYVGLRI